MLGSTFYHSLSRQYVIMFGSCFRDVHIRRFDDNGKTIQSIQVPIQYAPKEKWTILIDEDQTKPIAISLPRISFEITNINPDIGSNRKTSPLNRIVKHSTDKKNEWFNSFNMIPYKHEFNLYVVAKNLDDGYQIVEQILPYFNPDFTCELKLLPQLDRKWDIPIRFKGMSHDVAYEGSFEQNKSIIFTLQFEADTWLVGPVQKSGIIKRIQLNFKIPSGDGPVKIEDIGHTPTQEILTITPGLTSDGKPTTDPLESIPYYEISAEDDYGFCKDITNIIDPEETINDVPSPSNQDPVYVLETEDDADLIVMG